MTPHQLTQIRELTGLDREQFGEKIDYSFYSIQSKELGRRGIDKRFIKIIQKKYKKAFDMVMK